MLFFLHRVERGKGTSDKSYMTKEEKQRIRLKDMDKKSVKTNDTKTKDYETKEQGTQTRRTKDKGLPSKTPTSKQHCFSATNKTKLSPPRASQKKKEKHTPEGLADLRLK